MTQIESRKGFFPVVAADQVTVEQAYAAAVLCGDEVSMSQAGASMVAAAGSVSIREGGCLALAAGGDVDIDRGGAGVVAAGDVTVKDGFVGLAVGGRVALDNCRVLLGTAQAAAAGAALGSVVMLGTLLARRR